MCGARRPSDGCMLKGIRIGQVGGRTLLLALVDDSWLFFSIVFAQRKGIIPRDSRRNTGLIFLQAPKLR